MEAKGKKSFLTGIPAWGLSLLAAFFAFILLFVLAGLLSAILKNEAGEGSAYIVCGTLIATACFFICKRDPKSFWYVPVLSNIMGIIAAIIEPNFWITSMWIVYCIGWGLSIIGTIFGTIIGRRAKNQNTQYKDLS